jgi:ribosome maturation factor RimP
MKSAYQKSMEERLTAIIEPVVTEYGCELVELQLVQRKANALVRVLVDKFGGVTIDDCAAVSHQVSFLLDASDPLESRYTLEVSSPGLDRPLATPADFRRKVGETVRLFIQNSQGSRERLGEIVQIDDQTLTLRTSDGEERFPLSDIVKGKIIF